MELWQVLFENTGKMILTVYVSSNDLKSQSTLKKRKKERKKERKLRPGSPGLSSVTEHLSNMHNALGSIPGTTKKKRERKLS
jgi:hypothetical protein